METGEIALTGRTYSSNTYKPSMTKIRADGTSDATFNFDGFIDINFNQGENSNNNFAQYNASTGTVILIGTSGDNVAIAGVKMHYGASVTTIDQKLRFVPNPATNSISIKHDLPFDQVRILDLQGRVVLTSNEKHLDISNLDTGVYIVLIDNQSAVYSGRLLVE
jgi:hypothetical protein